MSDHEDHADVMYHEAYALFSYLYRHRRSELAAYIRAVPELRPGRFSAAEHLAIFERHFGPAEQLEATWLRHEPAADGRIASEAVVVLGKDGSADLC
jgi:hypothetical protein